MVTLSVRDKVKEAPRASSRHERVPGMPIERQWYLGRWITGAVILGILGLLVHTVAVDRHMQWPAVWHYLFSPIILGGLLVTVYLTVLAQLIGTLLGVIAAVWEMGRNPVLRYLSYLYLWFFRGTPSLVQLLFWFNLALIFPRLSIPLPGVHVSANVNHVITPFIAAALGLSLNTGAYMADIIRAGLESVPAGQVEAAKSLGMGSVTRFRRVILPQAVPVIIPPAGNFFISLLKETSLVSVIGGGDLLTQTEVLYAQNFLVVPLLLDACIWYLALTTIMTVAQRRLERALSVERRFDRYKARTRQGSVTIPVEQAGQPV